MKTQITLSELKNLVKSEISMLLEAHDDLDFDIDFYRQAKKQAEKEKRGEEKKKVPDVSDYEYEKYPDKRVTRLMGGKQTERELLRRMLGGLNVRQFAEKYKMSIATVSRRLRQMMLPTLRRQAGEEPTGVEARKAEEAARELGLKQISQLEPRTGDEEHQGEQAVADYDIFLKFASELIPIGSPSKPKELAADPNFQNAIIEFAQQYYGEVKLLSAEIKKLTDQLQALAEEEPVNQAKFDTVNSNLKRLMRELGKRIGKDTSKL